MPLPAPRLRQAGRCKAPEMLRSETYLLYVATTKNEGNAADGRFSVAFYSIFLHSMTGFPSTLLTKIALPSSMGSVSG